MAKGLLYKNLKGQFFRFATEKFVYFTLIIVSLPCVSCRLTDGRAVKPIAITGRAPPLQNAYDSFDLELESLYSFL